jgi:hypothetical protein
MKAHELAAILLQNPDCEVYTSDDGLIERLNGVSLVTVIVQTLSDSVDVFTPEMAESARYSIAEFPTRDFAKEYQELVSDEDETRLMEKTDHWGTFEVFMSLCKDSNDRDINNLSQYHANPVVILI